MFVCKHPTHDWRGEPRPSRLSHLSKGLWVSAGGAGWTLTVTVSRIMWLRLYSERQPLTHHMQSLAIITSQSTLESTQSVQISASDCVYIYLYHTYHWSRRPCQGRSCIVEAAETSTSVVFLCIFCLDKCEFQHCICNTFARAPFLTPKCTRIAISYLFFYNKMLSYRRETALQGAL